MITLKLWNSFTQATRQDLINLYGSNMRIAPEPYHHSFDFDLQGKRLKALLECCNLQKDGTINFTVSITPKYAPAPAVKAPTQSVSTNTASININDFLFTRTRPKEKIRVINALTDRQVLAVTASTIERIVKEVGEYRYKGTRDKELRLYGDFCYGNRWNSQVISVQFSRKKLYLDFYLQYENTDTDQWDEAYKFLRSGTYQGAAKRDDRNGNPCHYYFNYDEDDKVRVLRGILLKYVHDKYKDKLDESDK